MDATTQRLIDRIKRNLPYGTDDDTTIAQRIGDTFEDIGTDTGYEFSFVDETDFAITPSVAGDANVKFRNAMFYKVKEVYLLKKKDEATAKAVIVKSGRDMVDTTKAVGGYENAIKQTNDAYKRCINQINISGSASEVNTENTNE